MEALWDGDLSPFQAVQKGLKPYRDLGFGLVRTDWPWCPRWFAARYDGQLHGSEARINGAPSVSFIQQVHGFWKRGMLADLVKPPWTPVFVDLLLFYDLLEREQKRQSDERASRDLEGRFKGAL